MNVFKQEIKKTILKRNILLLLLFVLILRGIYGVYFQEASPSVNLYVEDCKEEYFSYLSQIGGYIDAEKSSYIQALVNEYEQANLKLLETIDKDIENSISKEEYTNTVVSLSEVLNKKNIISVLSSNYEYASQDTEHRYITYQNGWINFFEHFGMDICLLFLIIITITPIFCNEYETEMHILNRISLLGDSCLYWTKLIVGVMSSIMFAVILWAEDILINQMRFGLPHANYPIQSLHIFSDCQWDITIGQCVLFSLGIRIVGAVYLATILMFTSVILKKAVSVILISTSITILPLYILPTHNLYSLPLPSGFIEINGYLLGIFDTEIGQTTFFEQKEIIILMITVCIMITIAAFLIKLFYSKRNHFKKITILPLFCFIITLTGCNTNTNNTNDVVFNNSGLGFLTTGDDYIIHTCGIPYTIITDGAEEPLFRDPFLSEGDYQNIRIQYALDNMVYYAKTDSLTGDYDIMCINLDTHENTTIYTNHSYTLEGYDYLEIANQNLSSYERQTNEHLATYWLVDDILYLKLNSSLYEIDLQTNKKTEIIKNMANDTVSYVDGKIFFINNKYLLEIYSVDTHTSTEIDTYHVSTCYVTPHQVLFQTMKGEIILYNPDTGSMKKLCETSGTLMNANEKYFYCTMNDTTINVYSMSNGVPCNTISTDYEIMELKSSIDGRNIYVAMYNGTEELFQCYTDE